MWKSLESRKNTPHTLWCFHLVSGCGEEIYYTSFCFVLFSPIIKQTTDKWTGFFTFRTLKTPYLEVSEQEWLFFVFSKPIEKDREWRGDGW